jgi:peroxiredoxin
MAIFRQRILFVATLAAAGCATQALPSGPLAPMTLTSADGSTVALDELWRTRSATVLVFWSAECPCVRRYQERTDGLLDHYPADQVRVLGISSNAGESFADVLRVAKQRGVRIPIFRDESGQVAESVGARTTPTAVVIDASGRIRFRGWIDNERLPGDPDRQPWLDRAVVGVLEHRDDFAPQVPIYGCAITRSLFGSSHCTSCNEHN